MIREIKLRGRSTNSGKWLYGCLLKNEEGKFAVVKPFKVNMDNECSCCEVDEETIGQFTGLKDKNNKEIYEGDIVLQQGYNGKKIPMVVKFENGAFIVGYHKGSSTRKTPMLVSSKCEVIGNIYDNINLLEDGK